MGVRLERFDLGPGRVWGFIHRKEDDLHAAIQPYVSEKSYRCFEVELAGRDIHPPRDPNLFRLWPTCFEDININAVRSSQRTVEALEPEWFEEVREKWNTYRDFSSVVFHSELEPETVYAIAEILYMRGEIAPDGEWS